MVVGIVKACGRKLTLPVPPAASSPTGASSLKTSTGALTRHDDRVLLAHSCRRGRHGILSSWPWAPKSSKFACKLGWRCASLGIVTGGLLRTPLRGSLIRFRTCASKRRLCSAGQRRRSWSARSLHIGRLESQSSLTKRICGLIRAPSLQTRYDQSANWSNPKVHLQTSRRICKFGRVSRLVDRVSRLDHIANSC